ncbi:MAG: acyl-CoA thioesterase [Chitinophagales bacterium]|nr:acyl-CoA thioesterase [Chitinophagales bacterium]
MKLKTPQDSINIHTELIMPGQTNPLGNLMGGNLLSWMDVCCGISALKHCGTICVTASVDNVSFRLPIKVGDVVVLKSFATRAFNTSLEICCEVYIHNPRTGEDTLSHTAFFTFVSIDGNGNRLKVPTLSPLTNRDKELFESAMRRREFRLFLAGKLKANEIKGFKFPMEF